MQKGESIFWAGSWTRAEVCLTKRKMNNGQSRDKFELSKYRLFLFFSIKKLNSMIFHSSLFSSKTSKKANQETYLPRHSLLVNVHFIVHSQFIWMWELQHAYTPLTNFLHFSKWSLINNYAAMETAFNRPFG